jgi:hypothetical protein
MTLVRAAGLLLLLLAVPACSLMGGEEGEWTERVLTSAPPRRDLLGYCASGMAQAGFPAPRTDEAHASVGSDWRNELRPFGGSGRRYRATLAIASGENGATLLRARVEVQANGELGRPLDPALADWEDQPDDATRARILLQHVVTLLETSGAGSDR